MDKDFLSLLSAIALNRILGNNPRFSHHLLDSLSNISDVFFLSGRERMRLLGTLGGAVGQISQKALDDAGEEFERLSGEGIQFLPIHDAGYPSLLKECPDAPLLLYVRSSTPAKEIFNRAPSISIVGTRDMTLYGKNCCERIVAALSAAQKRPMVVSGLAIGVDITAHLAALGHSLPTVAVLPVGIDGVYPGIHRTSAGKIAASEGSALVTDFPPGTAIFKSNFLRRNRIIAGLSQATILVESRLKGGGTLTCRLASGYGREVFSVPGRLDDIHSMGCNLLIGERIAGAIHSMEDLCDSLGLGLLDRRRKEDLSREIEERYGTVLDNADLCLAKIIALKVKRERGISLDGICRELGLAYADASRIANLLQSDSLLEIDLAGRCSIRIS